LSLLRWLFLPLLLALAWFVPRFGDRWFTPWEQAFVRFASRKQLAILSVFLIATLTRLALLWALPVPVPGVHDEFSYLLQADTFLHGRLTNPSHPMSLFLDTFHVLFHPTYQSMYPPAQGAVLAFGGLLGHPWIGVLLSMAGLCAAMTWMLQAWVPPRWALLGGFIVLLHFHLCSYWTDSYWGGAAAAIGAALTLGAFPRIIHQRRSRDAVLLGIGIGLLANSRPLEGFIFCIPLGAALLLWLISRRGATLRITARRVVLPLLTVLAVTAIFMGYYNWRVTQNVTVFPRALDQKERLNLPIFLWESARPPLHYVNPEFEHFYNGTEPSLYLLPWTTLCRKNAHAWWTFYMGSSLALVLAALPWLIRDRRMRLPLVLFVWCALGLLSVRYFFPHYAAPLSAAFVILLVQAIRHVRRFELMGRPIGIFLTRLIVILLLLRVGLLTAKAYRNPLHDWSMHRAQIQRQLQATPGKHLVIVRYSALHYPGHEWVYNDADIDKSKIVWAREIPYLDMTPLLDYFQGRQVWVVQADQFPQEVKPYPDLQPSLTHAP